MASIKVNVCVYAFDCLYLNGRALLQEPLTARRAALHEALVESKGHLELATAKVCVCVLVGGVGCEGWGLEGCGGGVSRKTQEQVALWWYRQTCCCTAAGVPQTSRDIEELTRCLDESVEAGTEGLIVKTVAGERCGAVRGGAVPRVCEGGRAMGCRTSIATRIRCCGLFTRTRLLRCQ